MGEQLTKGARDADLMGESIIGIYLATEPLCESNRPVEDDEPRLRRFVDDQENIQRPRLIGSGKHGVVILTTIKGAAYALKVFKYWKQPGPVFYAYDRAIHTSPLACECRAYARLDSLNENGTWAARCYGWMRLSDTQFKVLGDVVNTHGLSRWAIVKEYIPSSTLPCDIQTIFTNFNTPKQARILPQDIRVENYRGSKIVDLSSTLTAPCPEWSGFLFEFFYKKTIFGVFDWFKG
ncbi:hypothetical protein AYO21_12002 [Fonsecaea monophora]|uniref:Protein kinase domain-containing protein n=1 Tax=Fonsecaea monophora TaxID=254056 RepID=A0A177EQI0_9EURO|nr:hypothetical protein AYO21_12002 [Fonsecaea monophora]OAG33886.1 hypothetical protein AYO21_12002 [Fonsecaea monophora]